MADLLLRPYPWQSEAWQQLAQQAQGQRLPHAILLAGPAGIGKVAFATAFMQRILCLTPSASMACGECKSCQLLAAGNHPDFHAVAAKEDGKAIGIDQVRELCSQLGQTSQQGGWKTALITPAEAMTVQSANALLKNLEEPPGKTLMVLVSHEPHRLLPTIRSRCRVQPLVTPGHAEALAWLQHSLPDLSPEQHAALLLMAGGAPLRAVALQAIDAASLREQVVEGVKALLKSQQSASQLAERWTSVPLELLADWFCDWTLDLLRLKTGAADVPVNADMDKVLPFMARHLQLPALLDWQSWLLQHRGMLLGKANLNRVLFIETLLIRWKQLLERR